MSVLNGISGRIRDCDSHEMYPARLWADVFGGQAGLLAALVSDHAPDAKSSLNAAIDRDEAVLSDETLDSIWGAGSYAPGAFDMQRRVEMMDFCGIDEGFIFPSGVGLFGLFCLCDPPIEMLQELGLPAGVEIDVVDIGRQLSKLYNDWCIETAKISPRLRPVAVADTSSLESFTAEAERVIAGGVRAIGIPTGIAPAGKSPGHPDLDPMWRVFTENNIPLVCHGGGDFGMWKQPQWVDYGFNAAEWGKGAKSNPEDLMLDPYTVAQLPVGMQNFLTTMLYGGVFERHPDLYVGSIEISSNWIGPMAENMDNVADQYPRRLAQITSMKPSEYIQRHVRVSSFYWEPVDKYIERYGLEDVYVFASDYPHYEGGKDPLNREAERLKRLGDSVLEKFFVTNASVLMP